MPKTLTRESVLWAISEEKLGFKFGVPERVEPDSLSVIVPLLRHSVTPRIYTTFPETEKVKVRDTGSIDRMEFDNTGEESVFIRSGTILKGATQARTTVRSAIVLPGEKLPLEVRCVHQSRGIQMGAAVKYGGSIPLDLEQRVYGKNFAPTTQHAYWTTATNLCSLYATASDRYTLTGEQRSHGSFTQSAVHLDDLSTHFDKYSEEIDHLLSKVKLHDDQVGLALLTQAGCETLEVFDAHTSWKALHEDAVKRFGKNLAEKDTAGVFDFKPERASDMVRDVLRLPFEEKLIYEHKPSNGEPAIRICSLTADRFTGEAVELDAKLIHLMILKTVKA